MSTHVSRFVRGNTPLFLGSGAVTVALGLWYALSLFRVAPPLFLPSPGATLTALWTLLADGRFFEGLWVSVLRVVSATAVAFVAGAALGVLMGVSSSADAFFRPLTEPFRYLPATALIPLLILWFGVGELMKVTFLFVGIVFYVIPLVRDAVRSTPQEFIEVAKSFGMRKRDIVRSVYIPNALPQAIDGLIVVNGIGWTYVVLAELVNGQDGLGYLIAIAGRLQRTDEVFAGLILIAAVAIVFDRTLRYVREKYFFW